MTQSKRRFIAIKHITCYAAVLTVALLLISTGKAKANIPAGYQEYYIPGSTDQMWSVFDDINPNAAMPTTQGMHEVTSVTATLANTKIYYDHWENGYNFDPNNPAATADETYTLNQGQVKTFASGNVPVPRGSTLNACNDDGISPATDPCYDGRDRIYAAGGPITVTKAEWPENTGTVLAVSWDVLPIKSLLTQYTIPVGVDLAGSPYNYTDFTKVYVLVQAVNDNTHVQINDPSTPGVEVDTILNKGEVTQLSAFNKGTTVTADKPVQTQVVDGDNSTYKADGLTMIPDNLWTNDYYNPATSGAPAGGKVDLYIYNPTASPITVNYEDTSGSGSFTINAKDTKSYSDGAGRYVPVGSGTHLSSTSTFWAIGHGGTGSPNWDWGFSLIPTSLLTDEYYVGWAPGTSDATPTSNGSPVYVTATSDNTTVYVDYGPNDGVVDATYTVNRLTSLKIFDPDNDNTGMHIWATGKIAVAWGEDPDTAGTGNPYLDLGVTTLPILDSWTDTVLEINKSATPTSLAYDIGQTSTFTLSTTAGNSVDGVNVYDTLPAGWNYVSGSSVITLPNGTTVSGGAANPSISGQNLTWGLNQGMTTGQQMTVVFQGITTGSAASGYNQNNAKAVGTRFSGSQTFSPVANAFVYLAPVTIDLDTTTPTLSPGGTASYILKLHNYGSATQTNVTINDILPTGFTYLSSSIAEVSATRGSTTNPTVGASNLTWGTWSIASGGSVTITFTAKVGANTALGTYDNTIRATTAQIGTIDDDGLVAGDKDTPGGQDPENDEDVTVVLGANTSAPSNPGIPNTGIRMVNQPALQLKLNSN